MIQKLEKLLEWGGVKKDIVCLSISGIALLASIVHVSLLPFDFAWIAIVLCGFPIILEAFIGLVTKFDIKADVLVSMALIASIIIHEDFAAGEVAFIMQLGALLEDLTVAKARAGIEKLVNLTPTIARKIFEGREEKIPAKDVKVGDILRVLPGETVPVDGVILSGQSAINQAVMTGESLPVDKTVGDEVFSGTVNQFGTFEMKASKVGDDSSIQRMIRLVQSADAGKAKIVGIADRWATWIVVIALSAALLTWVFTAEIIRAVTILVVFCPCALVLATPTAIMAAIGNATKHGFLVKEGDALEKLATVTKITFDKTGTLTYGTPEVIDVISYGDAYTKDNLFLYVASAEKYSEHPLGKAVVRSFEKETGKSVLETEDFEMIPGQGVRATVNHLKIFAGNEKLMEEQNIFLTNELHNIANEYLNKGSTIIYISINGDCKGFIVLADTIRKESADMIKSLSVLGVEPVLLTGDNENAAGAIAEQLNIKQFHSNCLPEDKMSTITTMQQYKDVVCMIGDGVNDAPSLKRADVGIAMGGVGSDIAVDAADIALVNDEVKELPHLFALAKKMMQTIKINMSFSMLLNFIAIVLAITGILNPVVGALVHNAGSVIVIVNSAILLGWKKK